MEPFGAFGSQLGPSWAILGRLGGVLGRLGGVLGPSWAVLGASWGRLGAILGRLGGLLGRLGDVLGASWGPLAAKSQQERGGVRVLRPQKTRLGLIFGRFLGDFWDEISILFLPYP